MRALFFFDQTCSGVSLLGLLSNSTAISMHSNAINESPHVRNCVYTAFLVFLENAFPEMRYFKFDRKWAKKVVFSHYYGAGLKSIVKETLNWVKGHETFKDKAYNIHACFNYEFSSQAKNVKAALKSFCPKIQ